MKLRLLFIVPLFCTSLCSNAQVIDVRDFGVQPNTFTDATEGVKKALEACKAKPGATLSFPKGRYDFWPAKAAVRTYFISNTSSESECPSKDKTIGILLEQMKNLVIEGNHATFMFHGKMITWAIDHCENIRLQNIHVDFERPGMSEMTLLTVSPDEITASIHPDSKFTIVNDQLIWHGEGWTLHNFHAILVDTVANIEKYSSWKPFQQAKATIISPLKVRFKGKFSEKGFHPGEVLTVRDPIRDHVGAFINRSANISLQNVHMHYMNGLGILSQFSENLSFDSLEVAPAANSGRVIAASADGTHFAGCKGTIRITNSTYSGFHDDPVNIHGTHLKVVEVVSPKTLRLRFMHAQTYGMEAFFPGDSVALLKGPSLKIYKQGVLTAAKLVSEREMIVEFREPFPDSVKTGDCLENITWTPAVVIRNNSFRRTNTRGLLISTRRPVLIENNSFYRTGMQAILIANDASSWYESGPVWDVTIRGNVFTECGYNSMPGNYMIAIAPENHERVKEYKVHHNIRIEENTFRIFDEGILSARSTDGLVFKNNIIERTKFLPVPPPAKPSFRLVDCTHVDIRNNKFSGNIQAKMMTKKDVRTDLPVEFAPY